MKLINIGYGNLANQDRIMAVINPDSAPVRRIIQDARDALRLVDATAGRRTRSVLVMDNGQILLSAVQPETIAGRIQSESRLGPADFGMPPGGKDADDVQP